MRLLATGWRWNARSWATMLLLPTTSGSFSRRIRNILLDIFNSGSCWRGWDRFLRRGKRFRLGLSWLGQPAIRTRGMRCRGRLMRWDELRCTALYGILEIDF